MLSKNFKIFDEYEIMKNQKDQKEFFDEIEKIENEIIINEISFTSQKIRNLLETILYECFDCEGSGLGERMKDLKSKKYIPTGILNQMYRIQNIGNVNTHPPKRKADKLYKVEFLKEEAIILIRSIGMILCFIINEKHNETMKYEFNKDIYVGKFNLEEIKNQELNNVNDDISTHILSISQLIMLKNYSFNIPTYQRDYTWDEIQIEKLLRDIKSRSLDDKTHYMGALAVANDVDNKTLRIIDGQQRITTSLIILKVFYDVYESKKMESRKELIELNKNIKNIYINQKVLTSQQAVSKILAGIIISSEPDIKHSAAFTNYNTTKAWLMNNIKDIDKLYSTFVSKFQSGLLIFDTTIDNEMDIFENLNTGGTQLNPWELIKNYMFSRLTPNIFIDHEYDLNKFIIDNFVLSLETTKKNTTSKLSQFFVQYNRLESIISGQVWSGRDKETYIKFKDLWPKKRKFESYNAIITSMNQIITRANIYLEITKNYKKNSSPLHIYSHILDFINKDDIAPLLIHIIETHGLFDDKNKLIKLKNEVFYECIKKIEKYFIRVSVVSGFGNSQGIMFDKYLLLNIHNVTPLSLETYLQNSISPIMPSVDEFRESLKNSGTLKRGAIINILANIEFKLRKVKINETYQYPLEKTHEHILAKQLKISDYEEKIEQNTFNDLKVRWMDSIGNALILTRGDNSKAGNRAFATKKLIYKDSSKLANGNNELMNLTTKRVFTFSDIKIRAEEISNFVIEKLYK